MDHPVTTLRATPHPQSHRSPTALTTPAGLRLQIFTLNGDCLAVSNPTTRCVQGRIGITRFRAKTTPPLDARFNALAITDRDDPQAALLLQPDRVYQRGVVLVQVWTHVVFAAGAIATTRINTPSQQQSFKEWATMYLRDVSGGTTHPVTGCVRR